MTFRRLSCAALFLLGALALAMPVHAKKAPAKAPAKAAKKAAKLEKGMAEVGLKITGMSCGGCIARITGALKGVKGIKSVKIDLETGHAVVVCNPKQIKAKTIVASVKKLGYGVTQRALKAKKDAKDKAKKKAPKAKKAAAKS